jgi:hypothetical protein
MNLIKNIFLTLALTFFIAGPTFAAEKAVGYFGWHATGNFHAIGQIGGFWTGEFSGSFENDAGEGSLFHKMSVRCPAWQKFDFVAGTFEAAGVCYGKELDGDEVYFEWGGFGGPIGQAAKGWFKYAGGTGKHEGKSGDGGYFIGHTVTNWADGSAGGYATWNK